MVTKGYFLLLLLLWSFVLFTDLSSGQSLLEEEEPPENYQLQVFLGEDEALSKVFAWCDRVESEFITLTPEGHEYFKSLLKRPDLETSLQVYIGKKGDVTDRYAIITEEMGCPPITLIHSTNTEGKILDIAVDDLSGEPWARGQSQEISQQFEGKSLKDPLSTKKILLGSRGLRYLYKPFAGGVKKMLAFINEFYIQKIPSLQHWLSA